MDDSAGNITVEGLLAALRRRILLIVLVAATGAGAAAALAYVLPPVFRASATILVESQQIPTELARSTVTAGASERLKLIEQRLMTRSNLVDIMETYELYEDESDQTLTDLIERMRDATKITPIAVKGQTRYDVEVAAFVISFDDDRSQVAARVANEFVSRILEQNVESRRSRATETHSFFRNEVERLRRELLDLEETISSFKTENRDALPDSLAFRRSQIDELNHREFLLDQQAVELRERERQLNLALSDQTGALFSSRETSPAEADLQVLRREFTQKSAIYSSEHPEIRQLAARIRSLERAVAAEIPRGEDSSGAEGGSAVAARARAEIESIAVQIENLDQQIGELGAQREEIHATIRRTPVVETDLNNLNRRYQELELQYREAVRKQSDAATGEKLEVSRQAEQFEVIEQAQVPEEPIAPNRPVIAAGGAIGGVALAIGIALLLELTSKTIHSRNDLARLAKLRPIATVPIIRTEGDRGQARRPRTEPTEEFV